MLDTFLRVGTLLWEWIIAQALALKAHNALFFAWISNKSH